MIEWILLIAGFIIFAGVLYYYITGINPITAIKNKFSGIKPEIRKESDVHPAPEDWNVQIEDEEGNTVNYHGKIDKDKDSFSVLDKNGRPIRTFKYFEINHLKNIKDVLEDNTKLLKFKVTTDRTMSNLKNKIHAQNLQILQLRGELERTSASVGIVREHIATQKRKEWDIEWKGRSRGQFLRDKYGKKAPLPEPSDMGDEGGGEEG